MSLRTTETVKRFTFAFKYKWQIWGGGRDFFKILLKSTILILIKRLYTCTVPLSGRSTVFCCDVLFKAKPGKIRWKNAVYIYVANFTLQLFCFTWEPTACRAPASSRIVELTQIFCNQRPLPPPPPTPLPPPPPRGVGAGNTHVVCPENDDEKVKKRGRQFHPSKNSTQPTVTMERKYCFLSSFLFG